LTLGLAVVIRSAFARGYGATDEMLNRYIGAGRKHDQTTDLRAIEKWGCRIPSRRAESGRVLFRPELLHRFRARSDQKPNDHWIIGVYTRIIGCKQA
jgi:hypothetical protein